MFRGKRIFGSQRAVIRRDELADIKPDDDLRTRLAKIAYRTTPPEEEVPQYIMDIITKN